MESLKNKNVLITGASRGIGRALTLHLAGQVQTVLCCARSQQDLQILTKDAEGLDGTIHALSVDLMRSDGVDCLIEWLEKIGMVPNVIIHNLGGSLGHQDSFLGSAEFSDVWKYNVGIGIDINRLLLPLMVKNGGGTVIHMSSLAAKTYQGNLPYVSAKCALEGYIKNMSRTVASQQIVMCGIAPGLVDLDGRYFSKLRDENPIEYQKYVDAHLPTGDMVNVEEIAKFIEFLIGSSTNSMVGSIFALDGGEI